MRAPCQNTTSVPAVHPRLVAIQSRFFDYQVIFQDDYEDDDAPVYTLKSMEETGKNEAGK